MEQAGEVRGYGRLCEAIRGQRREGGNILIYFAKYLTDNVTDSIALHLSNYTRIDSEDRHRKLKFIQVG